MPIYTVTIYNGKGDEVSCTLWSDSDDAHDHVGSEWERLNPDSPLPSNKTAFDDSQFIYELEDAQYSIYIDLHKNGTELKTIL